jgi:hypothetical protein
MEDYCKCGHERADHRSGFEDCLICSELRDSVEFTCRPGVCDRFTWDPPKEPQP